MRVERGEHTVRRLPAVSVAQALHYLNPVPIRRIHDRWIDKYTEGHVSAWSRSWWS
jgi:hypothetical protein